jgi:hypothetical protein
MSAEPEDDADKAVKLLKLAEEAKLTAETTQDPNRRRLLRMIALKYKRLAEFAQSTRQTVQGR